MSFSHPKHSDRAALCVPPKNCSFYAGLESASSRVEGRAPARPAQDASRRLDSIFDTGIRLSVYSRTDGGVRDTFNSSVSFQLFFC